MGIAHCSEEVGVLEGEWHGNMAVQWEVMNFYDIRKIVLTTSLCVVGVSLAS